MIFVLEKNLKKSLDSYKKRFNFVSAFCERSFDAREGVGKKRKYFLTKAKRFSTL